MERISCVLVTYNPNYRILSEVLDSLINQVDSVIIVDNSTNKDLLSFIEQKKYSNIHSVILGNNYGIAYAQNVGVKYALENYLGEYIIFLDQDSILSDKMIFHLYSELKYIEKERPLSIIGPASFNRDKNKYYAFNYEKKISDDLFQVSEIISSGTLVPISILKSFQLEENLFIDYVDFEWCWRLRKNNIGVFLTTKTYLNHHLGDGTIDLKMLTLTRCTPTRTYYLTRNVLILSFRDYVPRSWKVKSILKCIMRMFLFPLLYKPRMKYLACMRKGIIDGFKK